MHRSGKAFTPLEKCNENRRNSLTGLTFFELIFVLLVVAAISAFSLPSIIRAFIASSETEAVTSLGKLSAALEVYRTLYTTYPDSLSRLNVVNPTLSAGGLLSAGSKGNYNYTLSNLTRNTFIVTAEPKNNVLPDLHSFKVDDSGNLYRADALPAVGWSIYNPDNPGLVTQTQQQIGQ